MPTIGNALVVGLGGFVGAAMRYLVSGWAPSLLRVGPFPVGTAVVNVAGCLAIGLLGGWAENLPALGPTSRLLLFTGLLGGFTTYSAFGYETVALLRDGETLLALANVSLHLFLGFAAVAIGYGLSSSL